MINLMKMLNKFWKDESAQGATEYILLLVAVVAIVMVFKNQIKEQITQLLNGLGKDISTFSSSGNT